MNNIYSKLIMVFVLLAVSLKVFAGISGNLLDTYHYNLHTHLTGTFIKTSANEFNADNTSDQHTNYTLGVRASIYLSDNLSVKWDATTDHIVDYGFLDYSKYGYGIRVGRVNRISGLFGGFGPYSDRMNFLPQGTSPDRIGRTFFRFDGIQLYHGFDLLGGNVDITLSAGKPVIDDHGGIFDPTFYAVFDPHATKVSANRPIYIASLSYLQDDWHFFADYVNLNAKFDTVYKNTLTVEELLASSNSTSFADIPPELQGIDFTDPHAEIEIREPLTVEKYPAYTIKAGISHFIGNHELMFSVFQQVGKMPSNADFEINGQSLGSVFKPIGYSFIYRTSYKRGVFYTGFTRFLSDFDEHTIRKAGITEVPEWIDDGRGVFVGLDYQVDQHFSVITEFSHNKGASFLSATYQDPLTSEKYWNVFSLSGILEF